MGYLPEYLKIDIWQLIIIILFPFFYFLGRSRFWSAMTWTITVIKPDRKIEYDENSIYKDNLFARFERSCYNRVKNVTFFGIRLSYFNDFKSRYLLLFIIPTGLYLLFRINLVIMVLSRFFS